MRSQQPPERSTLTVSSLQQPRVKGGQVICDIPEPVEQVVFSCTPVWSIWFTSAFQSIQATHPNSERYRDFVGEESEGGSVMQWTSAFLINLQSLIFVVVGLLSAAVTYQVKHAFTYAGPSVWNSLPKDLRVTDPGLFLENDIDNNHTFLVWLSMFLIIRMTL